MSQLNDEDRSLYRFEYYEPEDDYTHVDWVWLKVNEINEYMSSLNDVKFRPATKDEADLYDEAYSDGYGVAAMMEFESSYDGITFRVELGDDGQLNMDGKKMFECAVCSEHKDFEDEVAMANDLFLGVLKDDKLWHICYDCAMLGSEIGGIKIEDMEEDES